VSSQLRLSRGHSTLTQYVVFNTVQPKPAEPPPPAYPSLSRPTSPISSRFGFRAVLFGFDSIRFDSWVVVAYDDMYILRRSRTLCCSSSMTLMPLFPFLFLGCTQTLSTPSLWRNLAIGMGACSAGVVSKDIISPAKNLSVRRLHVNL
jgi:hypothetical protein